MTRTPAILALAAASLAGTAAAQSTTPLPATLAGRWTAHGHAGAVIDRFSISFDGERGPGTVAGRLTWRGVNCGAKDEPIQAHWDGTELRFEAVLKQDVNTQRLGGNCTKEPVKWLLKRKPDQTFEGEGRIANIVMSVTATP